MTITHRLLICAALLLVLWGVAAAQPTTRVYLPAVTQAPTPSPTMEPTTAPAPSNAPWRRPGNPYVQLEVLDVEELGPGLQRVTFRNQTDRPMSQVVITSAVFRGDVAFDEDVSTLGARVAPTELRTVIATIIKQRPPGRRIEVFGFPAP